MSGFVPSYYIGSGALCQSPITVSLRDTGLVPKNGQKPPSDNYMKFHKVEKCRKIGTFLMLFISLVTSKLRTQRAPSAETNPQAASTPQNIHVP